MIDIDITPENVRARVGRIRELADDPEAASERERDLWLDVLRAISSRDIDVDEAVDCASEAIKSDEIEFPRY